MCAVLYRLYSVQYSAMGIGKKNPMHYAIFFFGLLSYWRGVTCVYNIERVVEDRLCNI